MGFSLLHELILLLAPYLRQLTLQRNSQNIPAVQIRRMIRRCSYGDFILLQILAKNLDSTQFNALISHLCDAEINYQLTLRHISWNLIRLTKVFGTTITG